MELNLEELLRSPPNRINLSKYIRQELKLDPFLSSVLVFFQIVALFEEDKEFFDIPIAGVRYNSSSKQYILILNYNSILNLLEIDEEYVRSIICREIMHVLFKHLTKRKPKNKDSRVLWNIATDLAINSMIDNLPPLGLFPGEGDFKDFPKDLSSEEYYQLLKKEWQEPQNQLQKLVDNYSNLHGEWGIDGMDGSEEITEITEGDAEGMPDLYGQFGGFMSGGGYSKVRRELEKLAEDDRKSLGDLVKALFTKHAKERKPRKTIHRRNRRFKNLAGKKRYNSKNNQIVVLVDESGSVSDKDVSGFLSEVEELNKILDVVVIPFSSDVGIASVYRKGEGLGKYVRTLDGGTELESSLNYVFDKYPNQDVVVFSDLRVSVSNVNFKNVYFVILKKHFPFANRVILKECEKKIYVV